MTRLLIYAAAALAFIAWASHRLYVAWRDGYVTEVDDPMFGFETAQISSQTRPKAYWFSVSVTSFLLLVATAFFFFVLTEILRA